MSWPDGSATGVGSLPGTDIIDAVKTVGRVDQVAASKEKRVHVGLELYGHALTTQASWLVSLQTRA